MWDMRVGQGEEVHTVYCLQWPDVMYDVVEQGSKKRGVKWSGEVQCDEM